MLSVDELSVHFYDRPVVQQASFTLLPSEIGCILGPSGCGKSTLLRTIAGFETPASGLIRWKDEILSSPQLIVNPENRRIGMVFQDLALFPHLNAQQNIGFGLRHLDKSDRGRRIAELIKLFELSGLEDRPPHELSGGEQQRVALARAMAPKPRLLLMDEAFSNLDVELRHALLAEVRSILKHEQMSAILVTHDQNEAFEIADKIGVMNEGKIHQWDEPYTIYHRPKTRFIAEFIGEGELIIGHTIAKNRLRTAIGDFNIPAEYNFENGRDVEILIRPDDILHQDDSEIIGRIVQISFRGSHYQYRIELPDGLQIYCFADSHHKHKLDEWVGFKPKIEHLVIFDQDRSNVIDQNITHVRNRSRNRNTNSP